MKFSSPFLTALSFVLLTACSSGPTRSFYVLKATGPAPARSGIGLGIGPVSFTPYLVERPNLVFQSSGNRLEFTDDHQWAGDLEGDFTRVLATNLGRRMGTGNLRTYPWQRESDLNYQITVDVVRFQGAGNGESVLEANWRAYRLPGSALIASANTTVRDDLERDGFDELAASQSRLVDKLAAVIAEAL
jgi:uncharacterized lipoprotein YmbA